MPETTLTIEVHAGRGVDRLLLEFDRELREDGLALLRQTLPAIETLDRLCRSRDRGTGTREPAR